MRTARTARRIAALALVAAALPAASAAAADAPVEFGQQRETTFDQGQAHRRAGLERHRDAALRRGLDGPRGGREATPILIGLLVPAVQKVREAAAR